MKISMLGLLGLSSLLQLAASTSETVLPIHTNDNFLWALGGPIEQVLKMVTPMVNSLDESQGEISLRRNLASGDFDALNQLFKGAVIKLPDASTSASLVFRLFLDIRNLRCTDISIDDIVITYAKQSNQRLTFRIDLVGLDLTCYLDYDYRYSFTKGSGSADAYTGDNSATVTVAFTSSHFDTKPPTDLEIADCATNINIVDLDFRGGFINSILNTFESLIRGTIEDEIRTVACDELGKLGDSLAQKMLKMADDFVDPYLIPLSAEYGSPLHPETSLKIPASMDLLDYKNIETEIGKWFEVAMEALDRLLGAVNPDKDAPSGRGSDLGINTFLRKNLLDEDRAFVVNITDLDFAVDGVMFDGHDTLTETKITLDSVKIFGLDTFTRFDPLIAIGNYTLQNILSWSYLYMEAQVTIDIRPSTLPDSLIANPGADHVVETVVMSFGADNINASVSLFLAIDQDKLGALSIGSLLHTEHFMGCLLSSIFQVRFSGIDVNVDNVREPTLDGFVSPGIDRVVTDSVKALFLMYENVFIDAFPNVFQTTLRDTLNRDVIQAFLDKEENINCPAASFTGDFVDFRDLLLSPQDAIAKGASGLEPYGNVGSLVMSVVDDLLFKADESGYPGINSILVQPFTKGQSGTPGTISFNDTLFNYVKDDVDEKVAFFVDRFQFSVSNVRIIDLDTITKPFSVLYPENDPFVLTNKLNLGLVPGRGLTLKARFLVKLDGEGSPLAMNNEFDLIVKIPSSVFTADVLAKMNASLTGNFPVKDIMNLNCWLATLPSVALDSDGQRVEMGVDSNFGMSSFGLNLTGFSIDAECVACESPGTKILPDLIQSIQQTGGITTIREGIEALLHEVALGDWLQTALDRMLYDAPRLCPHSPAFTEGNIPTDFGGIGMPSLSRDAVETIISSAAMSAEIGFIVFAERHLRSVKLPSDPFSGQRAADAQKKRYLNWSNLTDSFLGRYADMAVDYARNYLREPIESDIGTRSGTGVQLNKLLRDHIFQDGKALSLEFKDETFTAAGVRVNLHSLRFVGLDSATTLNILEPIAPQTLSNTIVWENLAIEVNVELTMLAESNAKPEMLTLSVGIEDVSLDLAVLVAMDEDVLGNFELGSLLKTSQILPCILKKIDGLEFTHLALSVGKVTVPTIGGFLSQSTAEKISESVRFVFEQYQDKLVKALPIIVDDSLRVLLNGALTSVKDRKDVICEEYRTRNEAGYIDFRDLLLPVEMARKLGGSGDSPYGDLFRSVMKIVKKTLFSTNEIDGTPEINEMLISPLTRSQSGENGTLKYPGDLFDSGTRIDIGGLQANIGFKAFNARIERLNSLGPPLSVLDPVENSPRVLNNTASFGVDERPLHFAITLLMFVTNEEDLSLRNEVDISLDLYSVSIILEALLKIGENSMMGFPLRDFKNLQCWLATIPAPPLDARGVRLPSSTPSAAVEQLALSLAKLGLNINCVACSSPQMKEFATLLSSKAAEDDLNRVASQLLDSASQLIEGEFLQMQIDRMLNDAPRHCPHRAEYDPTASALKYEPFESPSREDSTISFLITLAIVAACLILVVITLMSVVKHIVNRRNRQWVQSLADEKVIMLQKLQSESQERDAHLNQGTKAMFGAQEIPMLVRYLMPVIIVINIGFFLSGHLSLGATVNIEAEIAGESITVKEFFEFSMAKSTIDIWSAGGKSLAILLALFSGVWPYTKQLITLFLWFTPPSMISISKRGSTFLWLDVLAKWSMVDIFVLIVSIASFRVSIQSPNVAFLPMDFYSLDLMVIPMWGLYANMIAQLISQVSSHFIIHYHRRIVHVATDYYEQARGIERVETGITEDDMSLSQQSVTVDDNRKDRLRSHAFARPHRGEEDKLIVIPGNAPALGVGAGIMSILIVVGCSLPSFSLEVLGLIGLAVESGQEFRDAITNHSIFTIVQLLFEEASFIGTASAYLGLGTLSALLILTVMIVPIVQVGCLLWQWLMPATPKQRWRLSLTIETLQAWQYVEVYIIAIIVSAWQLGQVSEFMINSYCESLSGMFAMLAHYGIVKAEDAQCFRVQTSIEGATFILVTAAIILALMTAFVMKAVSQYERDHNSIAALLHENAGLKGDHTETEVEIARNSITPPPVLFTDTFRWFLRREDSHVPKVTRMGLDENAKLGIKRDFADAARSGQLARDKDQVVDVECDSFVGGRVPSDSDISGSFIATDSVGREPLLGGSVISDSSESYLISETSESHLIGDPVVGVSVLGDTILGPDDDSSGPPRLYIDDDQWI